MQMTPLTTNPKPGGQARGLQRAGLSFLASFRRVGACVRPFAKIGKSVRLYPEAEAWSRRLEAEKVFLLSLIRGMEAEFLATGKGLNRLAEQLNGIRTECQSLADLTRCESQDAAARFAFQLLKKAEELVRADHREYEHVFATFGELQERLSQLKKQHDELMRILVPLNFIMIAFRIEANRHPPEVRQAFFSLSGQVNQIVTEFRGAVERQFEELAMSERTVRNLTAQISGSIQQHRTQVADTLASSRNVLRALNESLASSGAGAADISQLNQAVSHHIGEIVMALQCQDITRQKIEHVGDAMDQMRAQLEEAQPAASLGHAETQHFVLQAGRIQLHHVQSVFDELNRAAESLMSGIQNLRAEAGAAMEVAVKVGGATIDKKIGCQCQDGMGGILAIIAQSVHNMGDILVAFEPLQSRFLDCTSRATALGRDVRRAALNAQIFAIHAHDGAALEVIARWLYLISDQAMQKVEQLGGNLHQAATSVNNLRQRLSGFKLSGEAEQKVLTDESVLWQKKLSDLEEAVPVLIRRITQQQEVFAKSVETVLGRVQFPVAVAKGTSRSVGFFQELVAWGGEAPADLATESAAARKSHLLMSNYTMASERQAHQAALQPARAKEAEAPVSKSTNVISAGSPSQTSTAAMALENSNPSVDWSEEPSRPTEIPAGESLPPSPSLASAKSAGSAGLGDNVELF